MSMDHETASGRLRAFAGAGQKAEDVITAFFANFGRIDALEIAMARVAKVTEAPPEVLAQLREAAIRTALHTSTTPDAAEAILTLAKAGMTTDDILTGGLQASRILSERCGFPLTTSAELVATAAATFRIPARDLPALHVLYDNGLIRVTERRT